MTDAQALRDDETPIDALAPFDEDALPSRGLLSFYDRLRVRVVDASERRGHKLGRRATEALLLVPDVFILMVRLMLDRDVPAQKRFLLGGALAYFLVPMDFLPEALLGPGGYLDDLVVAFVLLAETFGRDLEPYAARYWSGAKPVRVVLRDVLEAAEKLVGHDVYGRLRRFLARRGFDLDAARASAAAEPEA